MACLMSLAHDQIFLQIDIWEWKRGLYQRGLFNASRSFRALLTSLESLETGLILFLALLGPKLGLSGISRTSGRRTLSENTSFPRDPLLIETCSAIGPEVITCEIRQPNWNY